jgi:HSP20 family protein
MKKDLVTQREGLMFDPLFDFLAPSTREGGFLDMKTDISEEGNNYKMAIEIPGAKKEDIHVNLEDGYLTVRAEANKAVDEKDKKGNYLHRERYSGVVSRSYYVGDIDEKTVNAAYKDGVLELTFPKEEEKKNQAAHSINIQ